MAPPIRDYGLLGDCHSAALVSRDGSVDWWCPPRFDSASVFGRLLDADAGHFTVRPAGGYEVARTYLDDTMVVRTTFTTATGTLELTDALALQPGARGHEIGRRSPHALVRVAEVTAGEVELLVEWAPRLDYGLVVPRLQGEGSMVQTVGGGRDSIVLESTIDLELDGGTARASVVLQAGEAIGLTTRYVAGPGDQGASLDALAAVGDTVEAWRSWASEHDAFEGPYREQVRRSAIVLQALTYVPSGAVVAAPTTSLPEVLGGEANWDYRYAWLRDASLTVKALWASTCTTEAKRYFDWMAAAVGTDADEPIQIMFGVEGERDLTERTLDHLSGYADSRPVRVGNEAWRQHQLDVMGEILEAAHILRDDLDDFAPTTIDFLCSLAERAASEWQQPDSGIWEGREGERHYTSSKLMCWVALDRAVELAPRLGDQADPGRWATVRDEVHADVVEKAWCEERDAYAGAYGSDRLDASVLLMPMMGFLEATDRRMLATIRAIEDELAHGGLVHRWTGTSEGEGGFVICSFWMVSCLARAGELGRARAVFDAVLAHANDLGLLSEEIDRRDGTLLGNYPQALSHVGLINAAWTLLECER